MPGVIAVNGGQNVTGEVLVSGSKNTGLSLMAATLLAAGAQYAVWSTTSIRHRIHGFYFQYLGANIDTTDATSLSIPAQLAHSLRGSISFVGQLIAGSERAHLSFPGATIHMQTPSVTGAMNLIMAASREPEVGDLINILVCMGVEIHNTGTDHLFIHGRSTLPLLPCQYQVMEDRVEVSTFLTLGAICGNPLTVYPCHPEQHAILIKKLKAVGARVHISDNSPQFMVLLCLAQGTSHVTESLFERRFGQCFGLQAMGAGIRLSGALVSGSDLRTTGYHELERKLANIGVIVERATYIGYYLHGP
ncbi:RNA 3'-terminal phosphate cyclase/enolpyruvate transferase [Aspergillus tamarii]|uniref:UDP-N-acetylglucosamine 1-carboxyvinyltransferase n=1 Tax=Aspergillus tamarii TaxID=41984 RepID=A0A5N6UED7_ASPTM|nr:RNA 3'-terminal phosphate cyclase/enolpyruvate transferase [Aspergillus tamarii]